MLLPRLLYLMFPALEVMGDRNTGFNLKFRQNDYKIDFECGEAVRYNKRYIRKFEFRVFKYNRTCTAANLTTDFAIDIGNDMERKTYHVCNFTPDPAEFPPYIPSGRYKVAVEALHHNVEMFVMNVYGRVYRPFV